METNDENFQFPHETWWKDLVIIHVQTLFHLKTSPIDFLFFHVTQKYNVAKEILHERVKPSNADIGN